MSYTQEQLDHAEKMIRLYCTYVPLGGTAIKPITTVTVVVFKHPTFLWHVKVLMAFEFGRIQDITRYVGILGGFRFLKDNTMIALSSTQDAADTVGKVLGVKDIRTEVI